MIIGIDASRANREHKSGVEWYSYYLIKRLAQIDKHNQYILYSDKPLRNGMADLTRPDEQETFVPIQFDQKGFQVIRSPFNNFKAKILNWPFTHFWTQGRLSIEMLLHRPDVLFIPASALPIIHPRNCVVTVHDIGFERNNYLYNKERMGPESKFARKFINFAVRIATRGQYSAHTVDYLKWSTAHIVKHAKKIIAVSNFTKHELMDVYGCPEDKIKVIYNGYNQNLYKKITDFAKIDRVLKKYGIQKPYFFYVGRIDKKKNITTLIEAFSIFKEENPQLQYKLVLVGDASFGYDETKYAIEQFMLEDEVIMPGWIEEEDMPYLYSGADAFVFPSKYEGFGIPLLQALACEVPIIASSVASIPEVTQGAALLFNPYMPEDIARALKRIATDQKLRHSLVEKGRGVVKNFSWRLTAEEVLSIFEEIVS